MINEGARPRTKRASSLAGKHETPSRALSGKRQQAQHQRVRHDLTSCEDQRET